jgi:hypothetical protein
MLAYDLDGILVSDFKYITAKDEEALTHLKMNMQGPIFKPTGRFCIITGRDISLKAQTVAWLAQNKIKPVSLYHENKDGRKAEEYKLEVLKATPEIRTFVESSSSQAAFLLKNQDSCGIVHFSTFINNALKIFE